MLADAFYPVVAYPLVYILPAYFANAVPVVFGGGAPLDMGAKLGGRRIFGDNKTVRGTASSLAAGILVGLAESHFMPGLLAPSVALTIGANFGDLFGSFVKRRSGMRPGRSAPLLDQYGFLVFAVLFALPFGNTPSAYGLAFLALITGAVHKSANVLANRLRLKSVPW